MKEPEVKSSYTRGSLGFPSKNSLVMLFSSSFPPIAPAPAWNLELLRSCSRIHCNALCHFSFDFIGDFVRRLCQTLSDHSPKMTCLGLRYQVCRSNFLLHVRVTRYFGEERRRFIRSLHLCRLFQSWSVSDGASWATRRRTRQTRPGSWVHSNRRRWEEIDHRRGKSWAKRWFWISSGHDRLRRADVTRWDCQCYQE